MNNILKGIAGVGLILYPFFVAYALAHGQYVWVSAVLIALGVLRLFSRGNALLWPLTGFAILCGGLSLILGGVLKSMLTLNEAIIDVKEG